MNGNTADFDGGGRIQHLDNTFKRLEVGVPIWEHAKCALVNAKANARVNVLFCGLEPSITGSLKWSYEHKRWEEMEQKLRPV